MFPSSSTMILLASASFFAPTALSRLALLFDSAVLVQYSRARVWRMLDAYHLQQLDERELDFKEVTNKILVAEAQFHTMKKKKDLIDGGFVRFTEFVTIREVVFCCYRRPSSSLVSSSRTDIFTYVCQIQA